MNIAQQAELLVETLRGYESCVVAFSGGVDSAVVAKAAHLALGEQAVAATGVGPAVAAAELEIARRVTRQIGITHIELTTAEIERAGYVANAPDRCFHCKSELYEVLAAYAAEHDLSVIANGTNIDDLGDHRPGLRAADEARVRSPLVECGLDKQAVREVARHWQLEVWDKPAAPCLASRVAYGQEVTPERLRMIEQAESHLRELGLKELRVRYHDGDLARIEVSVESVAMLAAPQVRSELVRRFSELGFRYVTLDLAGFRSGNLNAGLPPQLVSIAMPAETNQR